MGFAHDTSDGRYTIASTSDRVAAAYGQYTKFFYIEIFLHEVQFETTLPITQIEIHCDCWFNLHHQETQFIFKCIIESALEEGLLH
jgi:hypothetical protein